MIIGFTGLKGSGKDTAAQYLIDNHGYTKLAFADKLKEAVANLFGITVEQVDEWKDDREIPYAEVILQFGTSQHSWSWREFLQLFGTEMGRETFGPDFWVNQWDNAYHLLQMQSSQYRPVVVTDVRFVEESERIAVYDGMIIEIKRPGLVPDGHASEAGGIAALHTIDNDGTIEELHQKVEAVIFNDHV